MRPEEQIWESVFTAVLIGFFTLMGAVPWPNTTIALLAPIAFLQVLGKLLGYLKVDAHMSPAVTVMLLTCGKVQPGECMRRLVGQLVGAPLLLLLAMHSLAGMSSLDVLGLPVPAGAPLWIVAVEGAATFTLLTLIFKSGSSLVANAGGTVIGGIVCPRIPFAVSMNPAMTTFAALVTGSGAACALALVGSLSAGVLFGLVEKHLSRRAQAKLKQA